MFSMPIKLHKLHKIQNSGHKYVVDLDIGYTIPISDLVWELIDLIANYTKDEVLERLSGKYSLGQIMDGLSWLEKVNRQFGVFYTNHWVEHTANTGTPKLLLTEYSPKVFCNDAVGRHDRACFFHSLRQYAEPCMFMCGVDNQSVGDTTWKHDSEFEYINVNMNRPISITRYLPGKFDAILSLAPRVDSEPVFIKSCNIPMIIRFPSYLQKLQDFINVLLFMRTILRDWDVLCMDYSWVKSCFSSLLPELMQVHLLPDGVDLDLFQPVDRNLAISALIDVVENEKYCTQPIVGLICANAVDSNMEFALELAKRCSHLSFLYLSRIGMPSIQEESDNLHILNLSMLSEATHLPLLLSALDAIIFVPYTGVCGELLLKSMACGIPIIIAGASECPMEAGKAAVECNETSHNGIVNGIHIDGVYHKLITLLDDENQRLNRGATARTHAAMFSWDKIAKNIIDLIHHAHAKRNESYPNNTRRSIRFQRYYDKAQATVRTIAMSSAGDNRQNAQAISPDTGLVHALLENNHTPLEVEAVLTHILRDAAQAKAVMRHADKVYQNMCIIRNVEE